MWRLLRQKQAPTDLLARSGFGYLDLILVGRQYPSKANKQGNKQGSSVTVIILASSCCQFITHRNQSPASFARSSYGKCATYALPIF